MYIKLKKKFKKYIFDTISSNGIFDYGSFNGES